MNAKAQYFRTQVISLSALLILIFVACDKDDTQPLDNSLRILESELDGATFSDGLTDISRAPEIALLFSHTLNTGGLESALSVTGPGGSVPLNFNYTNTNSAVTITTQSDLEYETTYTLSLPPGNYGAGGESFKETYSRTFTTAPFIPANVTLSSDKTTFSEDGGKVIVTVTLSEAVGQDVDVTLAFGGNATAGSDYTASATSIQIAAGQTHANIEINATQDASIEGSETIEISIAAVVNAEELTPQLVTLTLLDDDIDSNGDGVPDQGFIINEVLFDPPNGDAGDANGDGTRSPSEDEFIEFVNDSDLPVDLSGFTLYDETNLAILDPNHTFPDGTIIPPGGVYVLFGGGSPSGDFGTADVGVSTSGNMNLSNADDVITILDQDGNVFLTFDTQVEGAGISFGSDQSVTRSPDINGGFALHTAANPDLLFSPGKRANGTNFSGGGTVGAGFIINEVLYDPAADAPGDANGDGIRSASEDEFIEFVNDSDQPVDLSGYRVFDETNLATMEPRHTFPAGTIVPPGGVYVLFGGGTPTGAFGGAQVGVSTTGNLNLSNAADVITILDPSDQVFLVFDSANDAAGIDFGADQSVTRNPDITGGFVLHTDANPGVLFSPGTKTDGSSF